MNHKSSFSSTMVRSFFTACGIKASSLFKTSYILGSHAAFFSVSSVALPLMGAWTRIPTILTTVSLGFFIRMLMGASLMPMFAYWVPGLCAALYWQLPAKWYRIGLPFICMILFLSNPAGLAAAPYALYWFIPCIIALMNMQNIWAHALASTFTAHAVGSVIWLYTVPMTSGAWLALIPVVACERLLYMAGIVVGHTIIAWCIDYRANMQKQVTGCKAHA